MEKMVEKFQCPGCVCGSDTQCGKYDWSNMDLMCKSHVLGTSIGAPNNLIALGLPKGFNKTGWNSDGTVRNKINIRLYKDGGMPEWDHLNVPVWAMEEDGHLFVRTFAPRVNICWVDVIRGGTMANVPQAANVANFIDEID